MLTTHVPPHTHTHVYTCTSSHAPYVCHRVGQLLATTLPQSSDKLTSENTISLYDHPSVSGEPAKDGDDEASAQEDQDSVEKSSHQRDIVLRNMLLDVVLSLLTTRGLDINTQ